MEMKKLNKIWLVPSVCLALLVASCAKEEVTPQDPGTGGGGGGTTNKGTFKWTLSNGNTTTADSSVCYLQFTTLYAYKSGTLTTVEINLSDMSTGTYVLSPTTGNEFKYVSGSINSSASGGTVYLTNTANGKVSGNFNCAFTNTAVGSMSGSFSDVPMR